MAFAIPLAAGLASAGGFAETAAAITAFGAGTGGTILSALGGLSTAASALGSISAGRAQAASAKYNAATEANNAQLALRNATLAGQEGAANSAIEQQKTRAGVAAIKTAQAANGVDVNTGSAVDVRSSAAELGELNAITVRSNAARQAYGYQTQASSDTAQSQLDKQEAKYDTDAGYVKGAATLLSQGVSGSQSGLWSSYVNKGALNGDDIDNFADSTGGYSGGGAGL